MIKDEYFLTGRYHYIITNKVGTKIEMYLLDKFSWTPLRNIIFNLAQKLY